MLQGEGVHSACPAYMCNFIYWDAISTSFAVVLTLSLRLIRATTLATVR